MLRQPSPLLVAEVRRGEASSWTASLDGSGPTTPRRRPDRITGSAWGPISTSTSSRVSAGNGCTRTATTATRRRDRPCRHGHGGGGDTDRGRRDTRPAPLSQRTTRSERRCRTSVLVALSPSRRSVSTCAISAAPSAFSHASRSFRVVRSSNMADADRQLDAARRLGDAGWAVASERMTGPVVSRSPAARQKGGTR
jgi:hypothetical protein